MPYRPKMPCKHFGCPELACYGEKYCNKHKDEKKNDTRYYEKNRKTANERGYNYRWQKVRKVFLNKYPLCEECKKKGIYTKATVVDHIIPHKGDKVLFWDENNYRSLCKRCHDIKTATKDRWS